MRISSKSQSGKLILAMFQIHEKAFPETNFTYICARKKAPVQVIGLYPKKNALIVLLSTQKVTLDVPYFFGYKTEFFPSKTITKI